MPQCEWKTDHNGADILIVDSTEKVRITDAKNMRQNEGKPNTSCITVNQLRKELEALFSDG